MRREITITPINSTSNAQFEALHKALMKTICESKVECGIIWIDKDKQKS